jgi:hypothetical protein
MLEERGLARVEQGRGTTVLARVAYVGNGGVRAL